MLNRQKVLLNLLNKASRPVGRIELMKWAFLLKATSSSSGGSAFYDFLPYKQGPFSFCLYREIDTLTSNGYVKATSESTWTSTELANDLSSSLPKSVQADCDEIVSRFGKMQVNSLIDHVYKMFPELTVNSERKKLATRPVASPAVYTAGYERLSVDHFLGRLIEHGIQRLIDVRSNPIARRYGFHKSTLSRLAGYLGIAYLHVPELGISSRLRRSLETDRDYQELFSTYEETTLKEESDAIGRVSKWIKEMPSVLVCMEADPRSCHRSRLAVHVSQQTGLTIEDLGGCCQ